jgi:hypothetical protein
MSFPELYGRTRVPWKVTYVPDLRGQVLMPEHKMVIPAGDSSNT